MVIIHFLFSKQSNNNININVLVINYVKANNEIINVIKMILLI